MAQKEEQKLLESFVSVGTPLPSLATKKGDLQEFKPVWEQEVVDEKGRRRFHGAFTGGFTAGYHGTAGSKEGWAPSTFKSSRNDRTGGKSSVQAAAEAFMDEEDIADMQASRTLNTASAYAAPAAQPYDPLLGTFLPPASTSAAAQATAALASLIEPASTRIGAQLMRRMGWRDGQGVGPRLTLQQRKKQATELGIILGDADDDEDDSEASRHYYAPLDRPLATVTEVGVASDRGWGLGYKPGPSIASGSAKATKKDSAYGGAKMTGDQDDDDDIYGDGRLDATAAPKSWVLDDEDDYEGPTLLGTEPKASGSSRNKSKETKSSASFHDGTRLVAGFKLLHDVVSSSSSLQLPPPAPRGWLPNPSKVWNEPSSEVKGKGKQLDAEERGTLLGEPAPPPVPKSVFDYLSARDKERLASLTKDKPFAAPIDGSHPVAEPDATLIVPPLDKATALAALKGFQPFAPASTSPDPVRQGRYTLYLQLQANLLPPSNATLPFGPRKLPTGLVQTISELNRELDDYARAARVFKPVSGLLAGRFTSGGAGGTAPKVEPGLYQPTFAEKKEAEPSMSIEPVLVETLTPAQTAVRSGMFGTLTRSLDSWRPNKLVCKRFGFKDPWDGAEANAEDDVGGAWKEASRTGYGRPSERRTTEAVSKSSMDALMQSAGYRQFQPEKEPSPPPPEEQEWTAPDATTGAPGKFEPKKEAPTLENVGLGDDEDQGNETLTYTKAPKDIFAAIFADSDDDDDDDDDDEGDAKLASGDPVAMVQASEGIAAEPIDTTPSIAVEEEIIEVPLTTSTIASYRPTFTPVVRASDSVDADSEKKRKKEEKRKKRKSTASTLSFDVEDGGGDAEAFVKPKAKKRSRVDADEKDSKKPKKAERDEEEMEWVEREAPTSAIPPLAVGVPVSIPGGPKGGRALASDLFD